MKRHVIVTGGRNYQDFAMVSDVLDLLAPTKVIHGGCTGADTSAKWWARLRKVQCVEVTADWATHGRSAGPKRNREMLEKFPDAIVVAFPGGKGTENCIRTAKQLNMIILRVEK